MARYDDEESNSYSRRLNNYYTNSQSENYNTTQSGSSRESRTPVIKGYGTINSVGVAVGRSSIQCENTENSTEEVEFKINIYTTNGRYEGEIYIVDYDVRMKINSNNLLYFDNECNRKAVAIFSVLSDDESCTYNIVTSMSPISCETGTKANFFAYAAPILNIGINIGGPLASGEIIFC